MFVEDVDAHYRRAKLEGAKIVEELHETCYGERQYGVEDLDGHHWLFSQHAKDVSPADWGATIADRENKELSVGFGAMTIRWNWRHGAVKLVCFRRAG